MMLKVLNVTFSGWNALLLPACFVFVSCFNIEMPGIIPIVIRHRYPTVATRLCHGHWTVWILCAFPSIATFMKTCSIILCVSCCHPVYTGSHWTLDSWSQKL